MFKKAVLSLVALFFSLAAYAGPVNINTASADVLAKELSGIGPKIAQRIVDYREEHGVFTSADKLAKVRGIGKKTLKKNLDNILIDGE